MVSRYLSLRLSFLLALPLLLPAQTPLSYTITTFAGNGTNGFTGDGGAATSAEIGGPFMIALDSSGSLYIADQFNNRIRKVSGGNISTVAGSGSNGYAGDGKAATSASLSHPQGVAIDSSGNLIIADTNNYTVRKVAGGNISTIAGVQAQGISYNGDNGPATSAFLSLPVGLAYDSAGNLYIADSTNNVIRKIDKSGNITTFAGIGNAAYSGDGGPAVSARLNNPEGVATDSAGNVYIADGGNNRIRKVTTDGTITTIAGTGISGFTGDGGSATAARLNSPRAVVVDPAGNIFISDYLNSRVRVVSPSGIINTIAGSTPGYSGDGGPATSAQLFFPVGLAIDSSGNIYVSDNQNNVVRKLTPVAGSLPVISASSIVTAAAFGGSTSIAPGSWIEIYGSNLATNTRSWSSGDFKGNAAPTSLDGTTVAIGGQLAYVDYINPQQVNVQVPSTVAAGQQTIVVGTAAGLSAPVTITVNATQPGLFAPASFKVGGLQYAGALFTDGATYVLPPNAIDGITSHQAKPGDTITLYGVGFGPVTPTIAAGQIVQQSNSLASSFQIQIGGVPATTTYAGLAPQAVGLYQFNITVPNIASNDAAPLTFTLNGASGSQTLYVAISN